MININTDIATNKIAAGLSAAGIITRAILLKKMKTVSFHKNIFLTAPGGYGKSVATTQLLSSIKGKTARLTIRSEDNNPDVFYGRLTQKLLSLTGKKKQPPNAGGTLDNFINALSLMPRKSVRCYLAVDDMHMLKNEEIINSLPLVTKRLPNYICLCFISRGDPFPGLLETGRFEVITKDDLIFTPEETGWLCMEKERSLTPEQITGLCEKTGGWAMYLSALLSGDKTNILPEDKIPRSLLRYLETRIWELWDWEIKRLLLCVAVPSEVTPFLAERLTGSENGKNMLERLSTKENAFLSRTDVDTYRFHDIFREFLLERINGFFEEDEVRRLHDISAVWYYEQGNYYAGMRHYIRNGDHEGINRCMQAVNRYHEAAGGMSVEIKLNFTKQYIVNLTPKFISENPYLISKCVVMAFHDGDAEAFRHYTDILYQKLPEIIAKQPESAGNYGFTFSLDFRISLNQCAKKVAAMMMPLIHKNTKAKSDAGVSNITQNLPYFHRSMRDYSEYYELRGDDMKTVRDTFGAMIGSEYDVMEEAIYAGILCERGELLEAARHALNGYHICIEDMQPETVFCSYMILASVLYAMGALNDANGIMAQTEQYLERKAQFLHPNFKALQTERAIRTGNADAAGEWLAVYASRAKRLPFYQICRHFTTLRAYISVGNYASAVTFGSRLQTLAIEYNRPLDQIESGLLTAVALWRNNERNNAVKQLEKALNIAMPYGFIQLFINEGKEILPLLWELRKKADNLSALLCFTDRLTEDIYKKYNLTSSNEKTLSAQQSTMLQYLSKGMSYNEIAKVAGLSHATVKSHILLAYKRLGVHDSGEAVAKAKILGLLK